MRGLSREQLNSRSEFIRRCGWVAISTTSLFVLAACGGGGGGGGSGATSPPPTPSNTAPSVQAGADQTIEWPVATVQLTGTATDDSSTSLTYSWTATSGPAGVTFASANAAATSVTLPSEGTYTLRLSVSDGSLSSTDDVLVAVSAALYPASDTTNDSADHGWTRVAASTDVGMAEGPLVQAETYALTGGGAGMIVRRGRIVRSWGNIDQRFDLKSTTKSIGGIALGLAIDNGSLALGDLAQTHLSNIGNPPVENVATGYLDDLTILQLATHTAGFRKPGGYVLLDYPPGTTWFYSDAGLNWLAEVLTAKFNQDLAAVLSMEVWTALGLNSSAGGDENADGAANADIHWRDNQLRLDPTAPIQKRELASGIYANANAMARVGLLFLRKGVWGGERILSESFVTTVSTPPASIASAANPLAADFPGATTNYGVLWWTNATGVLPNVPRDAYWAWGLGDSLIVVIPSLDIVAVRAGPQQNVPTTGRTWNDGDWNGDYTVLAPFIEPVVQAVTP